MILNSREQGNALLGQRSPSEQFNMLLFQVHESVKHRAGKCRRSEQALRSERDRMAALWCQWRFRLLTAVYFERANAGVPIERAVGGEVLVRVPERAVVDGVDGHGAVISPAVEGLLLCTGAGLH